MRAERARKRLQQVGLRIRHNPDKFAEELRRIHHVSIKSFTRNYLYTELPEAAFLSQYLPYKQSIVPEFNTALVLGGQFPEGLGDILKHSQLTIPLEASTCFCD